MMLFQRRLFLELLRNTATALGLLTLVLLLVGSAQVIHGRHGLTLASFLRSVPVFALAPLDLTLPLAVLVAVILAYGRWAADNELDTLSASGVPPLQLLMPGLVFGGVMAVALLVGMDYVKPLAERTKKALRGDDVAALVHSKLGAGEPVSLDERTVVSAEGFDERGRAQRFRVQMRDDEGVLKQEIVAREADLRVNEGTGEFELELHDFRTVVGPEAEGTMIVRRALPREVANFYQQHLTTPQLMAWLGRDPERRVDFSEAEALLAVQMRLANSVACILFVLIGVPVALRFRRHDRTGAFLIAFLIALFLYYPSQQVAFALSKSGALSPAAASWSGDAFLALIGAFLCWRVFRR